MRKIAVIGLSAFGTALLRALARERCRILALDKSETRVNLVRELSYEAVVADATDRPALESLRLQDYDAVVLSLGEPLDSSLLALMHLRDLGAKPVIAKAVSEDHRRLLQGLGADEVVFPDLDLAEQQAHILANPGYVGTWQIGGDFAIAETGATKEIIGKSLLDLDLRERFGISVVALRDNLTDQVSVNPDPTLPIKDSDTLIVAGLRENVDHFVTGS